VPDPKTYCYNPNGTDDESDNESDDESDDENEDDNDYVQ